MILVEKSLARKRRPQETVARVSVQNLGRQFVIFSVFTLELHEGPLMKRASSTERSVVRCLFPSTQLQLPLNLRRYIAHCVFRKTQADATHRIVAAECIRCHGPNDTAIGAVEILCRFEAIQQSLAAGADCLVHVAPSHGQFSFVCATHWQIFAWTNFNFYQLRGRLFCVSFVVV